MFANPRWQGSGKPGDHKQPHGLVTGVPSRGTAGAALPAINGRPLLCPGHSAKGPSDLVPRPSPLATVGVGTGESPLHKWDLGDSSPGRRAPGTVDRAQTKQPAQEHLPHTPASVPKRGPVSWAFLKQPGCSLLGALPCGPNAIGEQEAAV